VLSVLLSSAEVSAQEPVVPGVEPEYRQEAALFLGATHADDETAFTIGLDYEFDASRWVGVGAILDMERGEVKETLFGPAMLVYPLESVTVTLAPLVSHQSDEDEFTFRVGVTYKVAFGRFFLGPQYNLDLTHDETAHDFGVNLGVSF
jgi:hypothetical protein